MLSYVIFISFFQTMFSDSYPEPNEYLRINFRHFYNSLWIIPLYVNDSLKSSSAIVDLNATYTLIFDDTYIKNPKEEMDIPNSTLLHYKEKKIPVATLHSVFRIEANKRVFINLTHYSTRHFLSDNCYTLGFAHSFHNDSYSVIHQLVEEGVISSASFALISKYESKCIYLGGIPTQYTNNRNHSIIKVLGEGRQWGFYISEVLIKNDTKEIHYASKQYAYLMSLDRYIYAPSDFFDRIVNEYLNDLMIEKHCHILQEHPNRYFLCSVQYRIRKGDISFVIDSYVYQFLLENLWSCGEEFCILSIRENSIDNQWAIGPDFYDTLNLLFNSERNRIDVYSKTVLLSKIERNETTSNFNNSAQTTKGLIIVGFVLSSIGIFVLLYTQKVIKISSR